VKKSRKAAAIYLKASYKYEEEISALSISMPALMKASEKK